MHIKEIQAFIITHKHIKITHKTGENHLNMSKYQGVIKYYPEELVLVVKAGTNNGKLKKILHKNNQGFNFWVDDNKTIGSSYAQGGSDIRDNVLGIEMIDGRGKILKFGGEVMKNVAGYDVSRLLCGSFGRCGVITKISFKILPTRSIGEIKKPKLTTNPDTHKIHQKIYKIFDPLAKFKPSK